MLSMLAPPPSRFWPKMVVSNCFRSPTMAVELMYVFSTHSPFFFSLRFFPSQKDFVPKLMIATTEQASDRSIERRLAHPV